jgi:hypothetical protein
MMLEDSPNKVATIRIRAVILISSFLPHSVLAISCATGSLAQTDDNPLDLGNISAVDLAIVVGIGAGVWSLASYNHRLYRGNIGGIDYAITICITGQLSAVCIYG